MSSPEEWYKSLPTITRYYLTIAVGTTIATSLGLVDVENLYLGFPLIFKHFQIWRLATCFIFFGGFGFPWLIQMFILQRYSTELERGYFAGDRGKAEYMFLIIFGGLCFILIEWLFGLGLYFPGPPLVCMFMYVWSRKNPFMQVSLFSFRLLAWHMPFAFLLLQILLGKSPVQVILGIIVGHIYYFLMDIVPTEYGAVLLKTPGFLYQLFDSGHAPRRANFGAGGFMGGRARGHRLDD